MEYSLPIPFDLSTLRLMWWFLLGVIVLAFCLLEGFDMGIGMLLPIIGNSDVERRIMINSIGPVWEGNQVWLILGGGAAFAAWPYLYVVSFSGLYIPVFIVLFALILRPVGFKFRSKIDNPTWKTIWDSALFIGSFIPALVLGIGVGNFLLGGFPFHFDADLRMVYTGSFWELFNLGGLTWGLAFVALFIRHGGYFLTLKTEGTLQKKAQDIAYVANILFIVFLVLGLFLTLHKGSTLYSNLIDYNAPSNPTLKNPIALAHAGWLTNISVNGLQGLWILYALPLLLVASSILLTISRNKVIAFIGSSVNILALIGTFGWATFPFMLPSSSMPHHSLLIWDSSSSRLTLFVMFIAAIIFVPLIIGYTAWVYKVLAGTITENDITQNQKEVY